MATDTQGSCIVEVPVKFGSVNLGDEKASLSVTIERSTMEIATADQIFCGKQIEGKVVQFEPGDSENQTYIKGSGKGRTEVGGVFSAKGFKSNRKRFSLTLSFSMEDIDLEDLSHFSYKSGKLFVRNAQDLPDRERKQSQPGAADEDLHRKAPTRVRLTRNIKGHSALREDSEHAVVSTGPSGTLAVQGNNGKPVELKETDYVVVS